MATMMANKPAPPHQKLKRPSLPAVQTTPNGALSSRSSPSPLMSSQKPSDGSMQPPSAAGINGISNAINGVGPRASNRRRDSQRPGDIPGRLSRMSRVGQDGQRSAKRVPEPFVKKDSDVLRKHHHRPPSLIIHLHPTNFRLEKRDGTSDGSFTYNGPLRVLLEHIKKQTVPHELVDRFLEWDVKFYDGYLIVQLHDHRSSEPTSRASTDNYNVASVHNVSQHTTLTPYATDEHRRILKEQEEAAAKGTGESSSQNDVNTETTRKDPHKASKVFTRVLHPTPQSMNEELLYWTSLQDPNSTKRKQSAVARTPSSATTPHPQTPLSAVPTTPSASQPAKRQKTMKMKEDEIAVFESAMIFSNAPPLYLEPVNGLEEAQTVINALTDDLHKKDLPAPKTRKRTAAQMADDEAAAAEEEIFMLAMDENNRASSNLRGGGQAGKNDKDLASASFEPRFERWKAIDQIRHEHEERKKELRAQQIQHQRDREAHMARAERDRKAREAAAEQAAEAQRIKAAQAQADEQKRLIAFQQNEEKRQQQEHANNAQRIAATNAHPASNAMTPNNPPHVLPVPQANHSSPIGTPHSHLSPALGHRGPQGLPMNVTPSGQGLTNSPSRPSPASQHAHPLVRPGSQQGPSRLGTPQMPRGTPTMNNGTLTTGRMTHASPPNVTSNPHIVNDNQITASHHPASGMNPAQRQAMTEQHNRLFRHAQQMQAQGQPLTPQMEQVLNAAMAQRHPMQIPQHHQQQQGDYQRRLVEHQLQQQALVNNANSPPQLNRSPHPGGQVGPGAPGMSPQQHQQAQHAQQQQHLSAPQQQHQAHQMQNPQAALAQQREQEHLRAQATRMFHEMIAGRKNQLGRDLSPQEQEFIKKQAINNARQRQAQRQAQQQQQATAMAAAQAQMHGHQQQQPGMQPSLQNAQVQAQRHAAAQQHQQQMMMNMQNAQQNAQQQAAQHSRMLAVQQQQMAGMHGQGGAGVGGAGMNMRMQ